MKSHWRHDSALIVKDLFANPGLALGTSRGTKVDGGLGRFCPDTAMGPQAITFLVSHFCIFI